MISKGFTVSVCGLSPPPSKYNHLKKTSVDTLHSSPPWCILCNTLLPERVFQYHLIILVYSPLPLTAIFFIELSLVLPPPPLQSPDDTTANDKVGLPLGSFEFYKGEDKALLSVRWKLPMSLSPVSISLSPTFITSWFSCLKAASAWTTYPVPNSAHSVLVEPENGVGREACRILRMSIYYINTSEQKHEKVILFYLFKSKRTTSCIKFFESWPPRRSLQKTQKTMRWLSPNTELLRWWVPRPGLTPWNKFLRSVNMVFNVYFVIIFLMDWSPPPLIFWSHFFGENILKWTISENKRINMLKPRQKEQNWYLALLLIV